MSSRERAPRGSAPLRAEVELGLDSSWEVPAPRSYPPPPSSAEGAVSGVHARSPRSPTRSGTLRWGEFARAIGQGPPSSGKSPTKSGTLRWRDLALAFDEPPSSGKSPTKSGTLRWGDRVGHLPPVLAVPPPRAPAPSVPDRERFDDLPVDELLAPLLCAGLVRRGGRGIPRRRGVDDRREPSDPPAPRRRSPEDSSPDLTSAFYQAIDDDER